MNHDGDPLIDRLVLGRYRIVRPLARGGMGVLYLARQEGAAGFARPVVVKRVVPDLSTDEDMVRMFVREAHILSSLHHPGVVDVVEFGQEDGAYVMVLEYVQGHDLAQWRRYLHRKGRPVPVDMAVHVMVQVLEALHHAHTLRGADGTATMVVHRDVTPSNILLHVDGHVKLADFGIARMSGAHAHYRTQTASLKGKLAYLAPELFQNAPPSPETDVYACGVVLYEVLTGANPFRVGEMAQAVHRILHHSPDPAHDVRPDVPLALDAVMARAMAKNPSQRYPDAEAMAADLRRLRGRPEKAVAAELAATLRGDFLGELPETLGVTPIHVLDGAWRTPPRAPEGKDLDATRPLRPSAGLEARTPTGQAPSSGTGRNLQVEPPPRWRRVLPWVGATAAVVLLGVATTTWLAAGDAPPEDHAPRFILVDRQQEGIARDQEGTEPAAEPHGGEAATATGAPADDDSATTRKRAVHRTAAARPSLDDPAKRLGAAFARQRRSVEACFTEHVPRDEPDPRIQVRFRVATSGKVEAAELLPTDRQDTSLGRCLLQVARATRFPPQPEPVTFRIPIHVRTR
jgi:eukaryotic-like serine/threonine-protein kinase